MARLIRAYVNSVLAGTICFAVTFFGFGMWRLGRSMFWDSFLAALMAIVPTALTVALLALPGAYAACRLGRRLHLQSNFYWAASGAATGALAAVLFSSICWAVFEFNVDAEGAGELSAYLNHYWPHGFGAGIMGGVVFNELGGGHSGANACARCTP